MTTTYDARENYASRGSNSTTGGYKKPTNFLNAEIDPLNSTYKMLLFREGFTHPNTYYSKKKDFTEAQDKEYLLLSMIERFIGRNNCFYRTAEVKNGKTYSPVRMIEFWRIFEDDTQDVLILRMFHPSNPIDFVLYEYMVNNKTLQNKLKTYYELLKAGKMDSIGGSKARKLVVDEEKDFQFTKMSLEEFSIHIAHLYAKYPSKAKIDLFQEAYFKRFFSTHERADKAEANKAAINTNNYIAPKVSLPITEKQNSSTNKVWGQCLEIICSEIPETSFKTWFMPIIPHDLKDNQLILKLPSKFYYEWLEDNYSKLLRKTLDKVLGKSSTLGYLVG